MRYVCLICAEKVMEDLSPMDATSLFEEYARFTDEIKESGHFVGGNRLKPAPTAKTIRVRNGEVSTTDGPFAETKEQLGGYYLIEAQSLDEALQIAAKIPGAKFGSVEVRQVADDPQTLGLGLG